MLLTVFVAALNDAADEASEPEQKSKFRAAADGLAGMARNVAVAVVTQQIGKHT